jgi:glycosyltransferase 2 family protein
MRGTWRKLLLILLILVALAALAYRSRGAIHLESFNWSRLMHSVAEARLSLLLLSFAAIYLAYVIRALRWKRFCRSLGPMVFLDVYNATLMGFAAIFLLGRPGEPVRPLLLARKSRLPASSMFGIYVLERLCDIASTVVLIGLSLLLSRHLQSNGDDGAMLQAETRTAGGILLLVFLGLVALLIYFRLHGAGVIERRLERWRARSGWRHRFALHFSGFSEGLQAIRTFSDLLAAVFYSAAHWGLLVLIYLWVMHSFGETLATIGAPAAMLVLAFTMVGSTLQLPGVGGGAQVASFIALTQIFGVEAAPAAAATIVLWLVTFAAVCGAGVPLLIHEGLSIKALRRLARAEAEAEEAGTHIGANGASTPDSRMPEHRGDSAR